jgi:hypothetical protein
MSRYSRYIGALIGLAALPLFLACEQNPMGPSDQRLPEQQTTDVKVLPEWTLIEVGETVQLRALLPGTRGDGDIEWETSDPEIALVDGGEVQGRKAGQVTITAEWEGHRGMARVTVQNRRRIEPEEDNKDNEAN